MKSVQFNFCFLSATHKRLSKTTSEMRKLWKKENSTGYGMLLGYVLVMKIALIS
jgi:hypothetical protein